MGLVSVPVLVLRRLRRAVNTLRTPCANRPPGRGYLPTCGGGCLFMPLHTNFTKFTLTLVILKKIYMVGAGE
jgi:hypothetical protein